MIYLQIRVTDSTKMSPGSHDDGAETPLPIDVEPDTDDQNHKRT